MNTKAIVSALINALIGWIGAYFTVASTLPEGATSLNDINSLAWMGITLTGVMTGLKDYQAFLANPRGRP